MGKFVITKRSNGEFQFNLNANNGQTILTSEGYVGKDGCLNGIESVKTNAPNADRYDKKTSTNDKYYFTLKAGNGQVIGTSQMYTSAPSRDAGIDSVMATAPNATTDDQS